MYKQDRCIAIAMRDNSDTAQFHFKDVSNYRTILQQTRRLWDRCAIDHTAIQDNFVIEQKGKE